MEENIETDKSAGELLTSYAERNPVKDLLANEEISSDDVVVAKIQHDTVDSAFVIESDGVDSGPAPEFKSFFNQIFSYRMTHPERGCFLIFNQEVFDPHLKFDQRVGTNKDAYKMYHTAKHMGYEYIQIFQDLTKSEIFDWMRAVSKASHSVYDSFGCAILTHGDETDKLYARDGPFKLNECTEMFTAENCPSLAGKPKIFIIQACRGVNRDAGYSLSLQQLSYPVSMVETKCPNQADFLIAYSTTPGFMSWRNKTHGSWFVQSLHHCFSKYAKTMEIMQIMTRVNKMVAYCFESNSNAFDSGYKQIPSVTSRLTADLYFYKPSLEETTKQCPVCSALMHPRDSNSLNQDEPSSSDAQNGTIFQTNSDTKKLKKSKSVSSWFRKSFRKKKA